MSTEASSDTLLAGPRDEPNRKLLSEVHPADWTNPTPAERYDLVVLGAGTGGLVTAAIGAALGATVALIERHLMGGDCLNVGCVPSKAILRAARSWAEARASAERFGGPAAEGDGDFGTVMRRMREIRAAISDIDGAERFRSLGVDVFFGDARFASSETVRVGEKVLRFRRAVIATGARAAVPPIDGLADAGYLTNETVFGLTERPERMIVLGAGPIGCELAQAFARFGTRVTLLDMAPRILPREEPDAAALVHAALERDGVEVVTSAQVRSVTGGAGAKTVRYERDGRASETSATALLVALGRTPNLELDLEAAGVAYDKTAVTVDDRLRTTNAKVFAVGDVASTLQFTHNADAQARMVVRNALFYGRAKASDLVIPWATYTSPEVARVGLSAQEAAERGVEIDTVTIDLGDVDRAKLDGQDGFVRIHTRAGSDEIVGATIVAEQAGDLIAQVAQAMTWGIGLEKLSEVVFPYPTTAEALRKAADRRRRDKLTPTARRAFDLFLGVTRKLS